MTNEILLILLILYHKTAAAVYNYNETSEAIPFPPDPSFLSGLRNITDKDFIIGGLFPVYDCTGSGQEDLELLEAMLFAIDRINNDMSLLPNLTIGYDVRDTCNVATIGLEEALDIISNGSRRSSIDSRSRTPLLGIVGAAYNSVTLPIATLLGLPIYEYPLVSYASTSATLSNKMLYNFFLRTVPSDNLQLDAMFDLISHFGWEYVSVIFNDYGDSTGSDAFMNAAIQHDICLDVKIGIPLSGAGFGTNIVKAVETLLNSTASVVIVFTDEHTALALFEEFSKINVTRKFVWIASDTWASSSFIPYIFPEIANGTFGFKLHTEHVEEFTDYFSQLTPSTNIRNPFFRENIYYHIYCNFEGPGSGIYCPDDLTAEPGYSQGDMVPLVIDAVYAFAHALQNFLNYNCDSPLRWNRYTQQCDGMKNELTGANLLEYLYSVTFNGIQNHIVSFDENGDPSGAYEISNLQANENGQYEYISVGFWNSENALILNNTDGIVKVVSRCSEPCSEGMVRSVTNLNCPSCFECIPCVGPTYSMNSSANNCSLCGDNHWGNNPLSGSTHCVPIKIQNFSSGWSIAAMSIATIALIILATITVIFVMTWKTPVVKSSGREQMVMLLIGIGICCVLIYVIVAPPSTVVCVFQRIGAWLCFSLAFGALFVKIVRVARIFYWYKSVAKRPTFTEPKYQVIFTMIIVAGQLILVVIGLGVDPPIVKRDPEVVRTSSVQQTGNAPEIIETCQQPHTAIVVLSLVYNFLIIVGCTILGWMTRKFPDNFNEAKHVMFTSFTLMVVWVLFVPLYFSTENEFQTGVLALGIVLSGIALMAGIFFPRVYIIVFEKEKNTKEYASQQGHAVATATTNFSSPFQQSKLYLI